MRFDYIPCDKNHSLRCHGKGTVCSSKNVEYTWHARTDGSIFSSILKFMTH
jgi:hypothetical protein